MNISDSAPMYQFIRYDSSLSQWSLAYHYICIIVPMIEPIKGSALLSNLSGLQFIFASVYSKA